MTTHDGRDTIEEIKSRIDIVSLINESIHLEKIGSSYRGATSLSSKSGTSLTIDPTQQIYYDFAGRAGGGDVFNWIAFREDLDITSDFPEIVKIAAEEAGIALECQNQVDVEERGELFTFNKAVVGYYHSKLTEKHRQYIRNKWGINDEMIDQLMIGWAPDNCRLQNEMKGLFHNDILKKSGFFKITEKGQLKDHYRSRIVFPYWKNGNIHYTISRDPNWNKDKRRGKYIKQLTYSDEREYISKFVDNSVFYGEDSLKKSDYVYIAEGVTDCIRLLQEGLPAISPVTTRVNEHDKERIIHICKNKRVVRIINDSEENQSGLKGALDTAKLLESEGIRVEIIELPRHDGVDKVDVAEYMHTHTKDDLLYLKGKRIWDILLDTYAVPEPYPERVETACQFIAEELGFMPVNLREAFAKNNVMNHFGVKRVREIAPALKSFKPMIEGTNDKYFDSAGRFIPAKMSEDIRSNYTIVTISDIDEVMVYDDKLGYYLPNGEQLIQERAQDALGDASRKRHIDETVFHIKNSTRIERLEFDKEDGNINLRNGVYNIYTQKFVEHSPAYKFTYSLPFNYNPVAVCNEFDAYLDKIGLTDRKALIYEIFGYYLVPGYPIQAIFIFEGDGGNGKGTVSRVMKAFLGERNVTGASMQALETNPYALAGLYGKLALICGDMPPKTVKDTSPLKTLSGGDLITAQVIYKGNIEFVNRAKLVFLMNHVPEFHDNTDSWMRRLIPIPFNTMVKGMDENFDESILSTDEELSGIFNMSMKVLPELLKRGEFSFSIPLNDVRDYLLKKGNHLATFADACGYLAADIHSPKDDVYAAYIKWCRINGITRLTDRIFKSEFKKVFPGEIKETRPWIDGERIMCFSGYELAEEWSGLNLVEEIELYEKSRKSGQAKTLDGQEPVRQKKSDFSGSEEENEIFGQNKSVIINGKKSFSSNNAEEKKSEIENRIGKNDLTSMTIRQKTVSCSESNHDSLPDQIPDHILTRSVGTGNLRKHAFSWAKGYERTHGPINSSNVVAAAMEYCEKHNLCSDQIDELIIIFKRYANIPFEHNEGQGSAV